LGNPREAARVSRAFAAVQRFKAELDDADDALLLRDTIEGETELFELLDLLTARATQDADHIAGLKARLKRKERRYAAHRTVLREMMHELGETRLERAVATLSLQPGKPSVVVTDQAALPEGLWRRSVDLVALRNLLARGPVAGATLQPGEPFVMISRDRAGGSDAGDVGPNRGADAA